jgi:hypothetical protein
MEDAPPEKLAWGTAATEGTTSWIHQDDDGFAGSVVVKSGAKWWVVMKPCKNAAPGDQVGDLRTSKGYPEDWKVPNSGKDVFDAEAVLLHPGTAL